MKTNRFISLSAIFAIVLTFFACSSEEPEGIDSSDNRKVSCQLATGSCLQMQLSACMDLVNAGEAQVVQNCSTTDVPSSSPAGGGSSSSTFVPEAFQFLGGGYDVLNSAYINPSDAIKHRNYPVLNREKMFKDGLFDKTNQPQENFETVAGNSVKETINNRNLKIGASVEANLPSLPYFSGGISGEYENVKNSRMQENMSFAKLNYYNYKEDLYIKSATKEKLKDYLTETFKNDLKSKTAAQIIESYGTHIFVQYYRGGSLEANYTYAYDGKEDLEAVKKAAGVTFTGIPGVKVSGDISNSTNTSNLAKEDNLDFKYQSFGGDTYGVGNLDALKSKFSGWATSINESNAVICGIADFKSSFISIWDLASAGGFTTEANALKTEFYKNAGNIAFPSARFYKTAKLSTITTSKSAFTYKPEGTIAEIEIYALGAGGGGQGGDNTYSGLFTDIGTGGAGGGGAATYVKLGNLELKKNDQISFDITVGKGGSGGAYIYKNISGSHSGDNGITGGTTKVVYKGTTVTAPGGGGGGKGAFRGKSGSNISGAENGGGGRGGYGNNDGTPGGDGLVKVIVKYFYEEGESEAKPEDYGIACNYYCSLDTGCEMIRTDPDGRYGDVYSTCDAAITACDYYGLGRYNNATCSGTSVSGTKPDNCGSYCLWDTGCYEIKTDPVGLYGGIITSCTAAISNCEKYGKRFSNGDCL